MKVSGNKNLGGTLASAMCGQSKHLNAWKADSKPCAHDLAEGTKEAFDAGYWKAWYAGK